MDTNAFTSRHPFLTGGTKPLLIDGRWINQSFLHQQRFQRLDAQYQVGRRIGVIVVVMMIVIVVMMIVVMPAHGCLLPGSSYAE